MTALNAHSLFRFGDVRFQGASTILYRAGTSILTGLNGSRLAFVRMPPTAGVADQLFVAGGGLLRKVNTAGTVTNWGIAAPANGFTAAKNTLLSREVDDFDATTGWTATVGTLATDTSHKTEGTGSLRDTIAAADSLDVVTKSITVNLATYSGGESSPDEDFIRFWLKVDKPENLNFIDVQFSLGNTNFQTDTYTRRLIVSDRLAESEEFTAQRLGLADVAGVFSNQERIVDGSFSSTPSTTVQVLDTLSATYIPVSQQTWAKLRLPKKTFQRSGSASVGWANVQAVRFTISTNSRGGAIVYFDQMALEGGFGLQGTYKYHVTFLNNVTGSRSNANSTPVTITNVERQSVALASLPTSSDTQVDTVEIWRTVGNGTRYFKIGSVSAGTTTFTDNVADYVGLNSTAGATVMTSTELPTDNDVPESTYNDAWGPFDGRMWWTRDSATGKKGRVYHSPAGRAEAVDDFLDVTEDDDPTQKGFVWDRRNWVFTESKLFQITGSGPFLFGEVFGVPGTEAPHTVTPTPFGVIYQARDGVRLFNGATSELLFPDAVNVLFRGEAAENLTAFDGIVATYARNEYLLSDGTQTLAVNLAEGTWRDLGIGCNALFAEPDTELVIATFDSEVRILEDEGVLTDNGDAIPVAIEIALPHTGPEPVMFDRVYLDVDPDEQDLLVESIVNDTATTLGRLTGTGRRIDLFDVGQEAHRLGVRISGSVSRQLELYHLWIEVEGNDAALQALTGT